MVMKNLKQTAAIILFVMISNCGWSQTITKPEELTTQYLKDSFENALITITEVKDTYIKVKDVFDYYVDIDPGKRFISFSASYPLVDGTAAPKAYELMNKLNTDIILIKSYYTPSTNTITCYYYFWTEGGFTRQNLLKAFKMMTPAMNLVLNKDTDRLIK